MLNDEREEAAHPSNHNICFCSATFITSWLSEWNENKSARCPGRRASRIYFHNLNKKCFGLTNTLRVKLPISAVKKANMLKFSSRLLTRRDHWELGGNKMKHTSPNSCLLPANPHPPPSPLLFPSNSYKLKALSHGLIHHYHRLTDSNINGCCLCRLRATWRACLLSQSGRHRRASENEAK